MFYRNGFMFNREVLKLLNPSLARCQIVHVAPVLTGHRVEDMEQPGQMYSQYETRH